MSPTPLLSGLLAAGILALSAVTASANSVVFTEDHIYEDTFGNLIVYSPAGYKQIVVGKGYLAEDLRAEAEKSKAADTAGPAFDRGDSMRQAVDVRRGDCPRYGVLLKGRGYMYGLPDGIAPTLVGPCRR